MSDQKIAGCHECPLYDGEWVSCGHHESSGIADHDGERAAALCRAANGFDEDGRDVLRAPAWCPLRQGALTLRLVTKGESKVKP